jgi:hypothetical protein
VLYVPCSSSSARGPRSWPWQRWRRSPISWGRLHRVIAPFYPWSIECFQINEFNSAFDIRMEVVSSPSPS